MDIGTQIPCRSQDMSNFKKELSMHSRSVYFLSLLVNRGMELPMDIDIQVLVNGLNRQNRSYKKLTGLEMIFNHPMIEINKNLQNSPEK